MAALGRRRELGGTKRCDGGGANTFHSDGGDSAPIFPRVFPINSPGRMHRE
jgi:hypothetical protein